jgi:hypothetical protein
MKKQNCWEFKGCERGPGGSEELCPAASNTKLDGVHGGTNCGRACWAVAGTYCGGNPQGSFAQKISDCSLCDFYRTVRAEEGQRFMNSYALVSMLGHQPL